MDWYGDFDYDPDYPVYEDSEDGLDPETRKELERIKRQQEKDERAPYLPY